METSQRSSGAFIGAPTSYFSSRYSAPSLTMTLERANANVAQLLRRFENIIALAPVPPQSSFIAPFFFLYFQIRPA